MNINWDSEFSIYKHYVFTLKEVRDLIISSLVLGFLFSAILDYFGYAGTAGSAFQNFLIATAIVAPALILHELAHKFMAQKYGCKAHYVLWPMGTVFAILVLFLSGGRILFAALGAVMISTKHPSRLGYHFVGLSNKELGKIAASGPVTNLVMALGAFLLSPISLFFLVAAQINLIIAFFNLIPFPPLDGAKIFGWSRIIWINLLAVVGALWILPSYIGILFSVVAAILIGLGILAVSTVLSPSRQDEVAKVY